MEPLATHELHSSAAPVLACTCVGALHLERAELLNSGFTYCIRGMNSRSSLRTQEQKKKVKFYIFFFRQNKSHILCQDPRPMYIVGYDKNIFISDHRCSSSSSVEICKTVKKVGVWYTIGTQCSGDSKLQ